jgi:cytochrome c-type biogenesis protein CcmF
MIELGHLATGVALALSALALAASFLGAKWDPAFTRTARLALYAVAALLVFACGTIIYSFLVKDFSVLYVAQNSNSRLPTFYRVAALWGGHEGSLLLWVTLLSIFTSVVVTTHWRSDPDFMPSVMGTLAAVEVGFLLLILFLSSPFERLVPAAMDGRDLNPLLQDYQMAIHPPMLFAGYTGYAIPFAFAMAVLLTGRGADRWIFIARKWSLFAWIILTAGIALGGHWAYRELGWGGYWAWDPVENASLMPWLVGTALLHSVMVQEQRKTFRVWNIALAATAFALSILGTFLVRSGIISSVHAFASDPSRGLFLLSFFVLVLVVSFGLLVVKASSLQRENTQGLGLSREVLFLYNNLIFLVATLTVMLGTLFPLVSELAAGTKVTVAAPYFNQTFVPVMGLGILLMAVAPMLPWRAFTLAKLWRVSRVPLAVAAVAAAVLVALGIRQPTPVASLFAVAFTAVILAREIGTVAWARAGKHVGAVPRGLVKMIASNRRRYGGLLAHLGIIVMAVGFVGSRAYQTEIDVSLAQGDRTKIGVYEVVYKGIDNVTGPNWEGFAGHFQVFKDGALVTQLNPEKRFYARSDMPTTEPQRLGGWTHELYVTLGDVDQQSGGALVKLFFNPLVQFVWAGVMLLVLGGFVSMTHRFRFGRSA